MSRALTLVVLGLSLTAGADAQVSGRTVDRGQPLPAAQVELWAPARRLAQRVTNSHGEFRFTADEAAAAVVIAIRRIGYSPTRVPLDSGTAEYVVELTPLAAPLPEVSTRTAARFCPNVESVEARGLWEAATRKYLPSKADTMGRGTELWHFSGHVRADSLGVVDPSRITRGARRTWLEAMNRRGNIESYGYVRPLPTPHSSPDYGIWGYTPLQSVYAGHFVEPLFVERHTLSILAGDVREITLVFCPRSRRESGLEGTIRLARDSTLIAARWTYWNPDRNRESAGGEVVFLPPGLSANGQRLPLLPVSGLFWRRLPNKRYWQRWQEYDRWILSPSGAREPGADSARTGTRPPHSS